MRFALVLAFVAVGCKHHRSILEDDRASRADALWALAPEGTQLGVVASPRAVDLAARGFAAIRKLAEHPDFEPIKVTIDTLGRRMFGSPTATPADAGLATDRAFAVFAGTAGVMAVMPVGDRDKFMALKKGKRGPTEDTLEGTTCRQLDEHYICVTDPKLFDLIGKGSLRGKLSLAGARGDAELYMANAPFGGDTPGELAMSAQLSEGEISVQGRWAGTPSGVLGKLAGTVTQIPDAHTASGFLALNVSSLVGGLPAVPITADTTLDQLAKTLVGPVSVVIPAGTVDIQVSAPLTDPKPASDVIAHCDDIGRFLTLAEKQTPGACRLALQGTNALELDSWVEGNALRIGAHKGPPPAGQAGSLTRVGRDLVAEKWSAVLWGRGTMLNLTGVTPAKTEVEPGVALGIHALALVNELAIALKVEPDGVRFRGYLRTAWTNPPDLVGKLVAVSGNDVVTGRATAPMTALANASPRTPFADDFKAGQGGLMIPAATIGLASSLVVPLVLGALGEDTGEKPPGEPVDEAMLVSMLVHAYVEEAFPKWQAEHKGTKCPPNLDAVAAYFGDAGGAPVLLDPWGHPLGMTCDDSGLKVFSVGPDGKQGTDDDVRSW